MLHIQVQDTGMGIPQDDLDKIFEKFHQVAYEDILHEKPRGTGLGLTICKEIIEHYDGRIWADSTPDKGSTFSIALPIVPNKSAASVSSICSAKSIKSASDVPNHEHSKRVHGHGAQDDQTKKFSVVGGNKD